METFHNVFQCSMRELNDNHPAVRMAGRWRSDYFHNDAPVVLELGCGHGEYTVGLAQRYPYTNFIGIDIKGARMWAGAKQAEENRITNAAFLRTNIEMLPHFFAKDEVDEIWITFPDPQMKKATKRLTSSFFMQRYQQFMKDGGIIHLKTDSNFLYIYTQEMIRVNEYAKLFDFNDIYHTPQATEQAGLTELQTHYEHQWLERGLTIKYLSWSLKHKEAFAEPETEIEKDTYRSYGRNYVSSTNH